MLVVDRLTMKQFTSALLRYNMVVVILMMVANRMYKKRNGISLGRSPWRIDNCSIHRIQTEESRALITLASAIAMVIIINGINSSRHGIIGAWMGGRHYDSMACGHCRPLWAVAVGGHMPYLPRDTHHRSDSDLCLMRRRRCGS